jgi:N-methylhydantoinase B/oxoprolinase/acetone carboxylase alpha subunit
MNTRAEFAPSVKDAVRPDPITVEVVRNKLDGIANEMELTLLRSSFSPIVKEGLDASAGMFTADGSAIATACAIPAHLGSLVPAIAQIISTYPVHTMREGDAYILNDPYMGGSHLPDIAVVMPVFAEGRVIALTAAVTHHQDVGGMTAGSVPTNSTEIFQEGIRIPPLKLLDQGIYNDTLIAMLRRNVRIPDMFMGDLNAEIAACKVGARRIQEAAKAYGAKHLCAIFDDLLDRSELLTRQALRALPQGTFVAVDYLDNDGVDLDKPVRVQVAVTIRGDSIHFDFEGTSPQTRGPINCVPSVMQSTAFYAVRALTDPDIPNNGGCQRVISLNLPEGSLVNPIEPAPVNARSATMKRVAGCIIAALAQALPNRIPAPSGSELVVMAFGGTHEGRRFVVGDLVAAGSGAALGYDGVDVIETDMTNCMNLPAEAMELEAPIRIRQVALRKDSGGAGQYRGGLGTVREYEILADTVSMSHRGERHFHPAQGLFGGEAGAAAKSWIERADGRMEIIPSKVVTTLHKGDHLIVETAGGGGYGPVAMRDSASVRDDKANGKVSEIHTAVA